MVLSIRQVRLLTLTGMLLIAGFIIPDFELLPQSLHDVYITIRMGMVLPICFVFFLLSFTPKFEIYYQYLLFTVMLSVIYLNFMLILWCWQLMEYAFPYEGTIFFSWFSLFIFRLNFRFAIPFSVLVILGFVAMLTLFPIYGDKNSVNIGFVFIGLIVGLLGVYRLEAQWKEIQGKNQQLQHLSETDPLTGLLNRGTYEDRFNDKLELNKRYENNICVYFIDLDNFKDYNDGHGHPQGDKVIQKQANMLKEIFQRSTDIVARFGGEEFVVVTSNIDSDQSREFAEQIIEKWNNEKMPHAKGKGGEFVGCSVGYYFEEANVQTTITDLIKKADMALYKAKGKGRGCAVLY